MNIIEFRHKLKVLATLAALSLAMGCTEQGIQTAGTKAVPAAPDPRAKVLGVEQHVPAKETPQTTSAAKSDLTKEQQQTAMPLPGQANDHSTLSSKASQKTVPSGR